MTVLLPLFLLCLSTCLRAASALSQIAVVGGGTSGIFAAISAAEHIRVANRSPSGTNVEIKVYESTDQFLRGIRQGGAGGVLYDTSKKARELLNAGYPRGRKEITSLLTKQFHPLEQQRWLEDKGMSFVTQADGTMIPAIPGDCTDDRSCGGIVVADVLVNEAKSYGAISTQPQSKVFSVTKDLEGGNKFCLSITSSGGLDAIEECDVVILATGNSRIGHNIAKKFGHTIVDPMRSCFGLKLKVDQFDFPSGHSHRLPHVRLSYKVTLEGQKRPRVFKSEGPVELAVRDNGNIILSGMATFSLTSLAAEQFKGKGCKGQLLMHCCPDIFGGKVEKLNEWLWQYRQDHPREVVAGRCPLIHRITDYGTYDFDTDSFCVVESACIPPDLWEDIVNKCGTTSVATWSKLSPRKVRALADLVVSYPLEFEGRHAAPEGPFINVGGVALNEIDMSTMKSKVIDKLYCCGQVLDGDASHVSFNFMRDLAMSRMAGIHAVDTLVAEEGNS